MSKNNTGTTITIIVLTVLVIFLVFAFIGEHNTNQKTVQNNAAQSAAPQTQATNQPLQNCMSQAHQEWDGDIAIAEGGLDQEPYNFDKSQLDQQLNLCHEQYGY